MLQLENTRQEGFYKNIVQKLDMQIKSFDSDKNTQLRWIWQLIQNAKDAPNDFERVKIRQELNEESFSSSHNGNAFRIPEIHSLIAQYSTKIELNNQLRKTTGKYGTGFITTLLVSRNIEIEGYLKIDKNYQEPISEEQASNSHSYVEQQSEQSEEPFFYYKKFTLNLDRNYNERDREFKRKVKKADRDLTDLVEQAQDELKQVFQLTPEQLQSNKHRFQGHFHFTQQRVIDSLDTTFKYQIYGDQKIQLIQSAVDNAFQLMPYALLFNQCFSSYEFINRNSKSTNNNSFYMQKVSLDRISQKKSAKNLRLFKYILKTQYDHEKKIYSKTQTKYISAFIDKDQVLAAIPLSYDDEYWKVQKVQNCQVFKDFPLIGSQKIGWNAVINSYNFYPNQKRSNLMLSINDKFNENRVSQNRKQIRKCFSGIKQLYLFLALQYCDQGLQKLLIMDNQNYFTKDFEELRLQLEKYMDEILGKQFIPTGSDNKTKASAKTLKVISKFSSSEILQELSKNGKVLEKKVHKQISKTFRYLQNDELVLSQQHYDQYFKIFLQYIINNQYFQKFMIIKFVSLEDCIRKIEIAEFSGFQSRFKDQTMKKLKQIYQLIIYQNLSVQNYKIFLNKQMQFLSLKEHHLMVKNISPAIQQLLDLLDINYQSRIIHQHFSSIFRIKPNQNLFGINSVSTLITQKFSKVQQSWTSAEILYEDEKKDKITKFKLLYQLLLSFNQLNQQCLNQQTINNIKTFVEFSSIQPFQLSYNSQSLSRLIISISNHLIQIFTKSFVKYFQNLLKSNLTLYNVRSKHLLIASEDEAIIFMRQIMQDKILGDQIQKMKTKMSYTKTFHPQNQLVKLKKGVQYPTQKDLEILQKIEKQIKLSEVVNTPFNLRKQKETKFSKLIYPIYSQKSLQDMRQTTYTELFQNIRDKCQSLSGLYPEIILHYASQINDTYKKSNGQNTTLNEKYKALESLIKSRASLMFSIRNRRKMFQSEEAKEFLFKLFSNQQIFFTAFQNYSQTKQQTPTLQQGFQLLENYGRKKIKQE